MRRFREPPPSSSALFFIPSVSYVISEHWNTSLAVEVIGRWFDSNDAGFSRRDWEVEPIATLEYVIPAAAFAFRKQQIFSAVGIGFPGIV